MLMPLIVLGLGALAYVLGHKGGGPPAVPTGIPLPKGAQQVQTVKDNTGKPVPQPNTVVDPTTDKSYYVPPTSDVRILATKVAADIMTHKLGYDKDMCKAFQRMAGLEADGKYGGRTLGALLYYGVPIAAAPPAIYLPHTVVAFTPKS